MKKQICLIGFTVVCSIFGFAQTAKTKKTVEKEQQLYYAHDVAKGQTVYGLCKLYGVTEKEIYKYNPQAENGLRYGEIIYILISPLKVETYSVKRGETYASIAKNRGISEAELKKLNPDKEATLEVGSIIYVPIVEMEESVSTTISAPKSKKEEKKEEKKKENSASAAPQTTVKTVTHTVEQGESLYAIARKYSVTVENIKTANPFLTEVLSIGQQIIIPVGNEIKQTEPEPENTLSAGTKKKEYTVFVLIPLYLSAADTIEPTRIKSLADYGKVKSFSFIQFYEALLLASEAVTSEYPKTKINLHVEDVNSSLQMTELINSGKLDKADLIIGPFYPKEFSYLCQYAREKKITLVNPFSMNLEVCGTKVYKLSAPLRAHGEQFANYVTANYDNAKIIFASYQTHDEAEKINAYKSAMQSAFSKSGKQINIQEINLINSGIAGIQSAMSGTAENFVFTFFDGELRVTNFVQNLNKAKNHNLTLVAPQSWLDYDNIETEYFMNMKTHYIAQYFVDYSNPNVIRFVDAFRSAYDTEPTLDLFAFQGYDFTYYFLSSLCENGTHFLSYSDKNSKLLSTQFEFVKTTDNMLENSFVHIFKLKDYRYIDATRDIEKK